MRIFDLGNKHRDGFWCAAPDEETAIQVALAVGHARSRENLRVHDVTDSFRGRADNVIDGDEIGQVVGHGECVPIMDVLAGVEPPPMTWEVRPVQRLDETVKTADLFGAEVDTFATEAEFAGIREAQGALFNTGRPVKKVDPWQKGLL